MRVVAAIVIASLLWPGTVAAQVWRDFAQQVDVGSELKVRLIDGENFRATLVRVDETNLLLQPKTRIPVPVQAVPYDAIASLEPTRKGGIGVGKAIAIGVGTGVAAFWGTLVVVVALWGD
jgi:hypothetical protein